jgi:preprotein translocase subunit SecF
MSLSRRERREQRKKQWKEQRLEQFNQSEQAVHSYSEKKHRGIIGIYDRHYKQLWFFPLFLLIAAIILMGVQVATTGDFLNKGVSLKGGVVISIPVQQAVQITEIEQILKQAFPKDDIEVRSVDEFGVQKAVIVTTDNPSSESGIIDALSIKIPDAKLHAAAETTGTSLGAGFFKQTMLAMIIAFVFMGIVVFLSFKTFVPSMAVIICAFADILETMVATNLMGLKISTAGIAAFLMLIGYSVDTDILLTSRVLRGKEGTVFDRTLSATKTGLLMTSTTIIAVTIGLLVTQSATVKEIMTIMLLGMIFDVINTWLQNTALLRIYMEHKKNKPSKKVVEVEPEIIDTDESN